MTFFSTLAGRWLARQSRPTVFKCLAAGPRLLLLLLSLLVSTAVFAQEAATTITGTVQDESGQGIPGLTVLVKGTANATSTDAEGRFMLQAPASSVLVIRGISYATREVRADNLAAPVRLRADTQSLDDVVVTGTFDRRTAMNSSIAISSISGQTVQLQQPVSAVDLLRNVPGVYVNSANGEIRNSISSRGVATPTNAGSGIDQGYYYVSMQEDGLPVTNVSLANFGPDYYLRADASTSRIEALRGGTASILGPNAPGGIFNYLSRTGKDQPGGEVRLRSGIEGRGNGYYRADADYGGAISKENGLYYNVGGFYRYDQGVRYPGYPMNYGGQLKANLLKTYEGGSLKLYGKYLNDHNGSYEALPAVNFDHPTLAPGVQNTDTYLGSKRLVFDYPTADGGTSHYDASNLFHSRDYSAGLDWQQELGRGWSFQNNVKYSNKVTDGQYTAINSAVSLESIFPYLFNNTFGPGNAGTFQLTDLVTGRALGTVVSNSGFDHTLTTDNLNSPISKNVILHGLLSVKTDVQEVIDQFSFHKKLNNMDFTVGGYFADSRVDKHSGMAGTEIATIENQPHPIGLTLTDATNTTYQVTNANGVAGLGGTAVAGISYYTGRQSQYAGFADYNWKITPMLTLDLGGRLDKVRVRGSNSISGHAAPVAGGGTDHNPLTLYDNYVNTLQDPLAYDYTVNTLSYSAALNYRLSDRLAVYGRFSNGKKAPDMEYYFTTSTQFALSTLDPQAQDLKQAEIGVKFQTDRLNLVVTPFYSLLSNIRTLTGALNVDLTSYNTPVLYNKLQTVGVEVEADYSVTPHLNVRVAGTLQNPIAKSWRVWDVKENGPQDDVTIDYSGNRVDSVPSLLATVTPTYTQGKFFAYVSWKYTGSRPANVANTFYLPEYSVFDAALGYNFTPALSTQVNMTNIFNSVGVTGWMGPGSFPSSVDFQGFTPAKRDADPNAIFGILVIQPRSTFLSLSYKF